MSAIGWPNSALATNATAAAAVARIRPATVTLSRKRGGGDGADHGRAPAPVTSFSRIKKPTPALTTPSDQGDGVLLHPAVPRGAAPRRSPGDRSRRCSPVDDPREATVHHRRSAPRAKARVDHTVEHHSSTRRPPTRAAPGGPAGRSRPGLPGSTVARAAGRAAGMRKRSRSFWVAGPARTGPYRRRCRPGPPRCRRRRPGSGRAVVLHDGVGPGGLPRGERGEPPRHARPPGDARTSAGQADERVGHHPRRLVGMAPRPGTSREGEVDGASHVESGDEDPGEGQHQHEGGQRRRRRAASRKPATPGSRPCDQKPARGTIPPGPRADHHRPEGDRHVLAQAAHVGHVVGVERRGSPTPPRGRGGALKKAWVNRWKSPAVSPPDSHGDHHVCQTCSPWSRPAPAPYPLPCRAQAAHEQGERPDDQDQRLQPAPRTPGLVEGELRPPGTPRRPPSWLHASSTHRGGTLHCVGEPYVEGTGPSCPWLNERARPTQTPRRPPPSSLPRPRPPAGR